MAYTLEVITGDLHVFKEIPPKDYLTLRQRQDLFKVPPPWLLWGASWRDTVLLIYTTLKAIIFMLEGI